MCIKIKMNFKDPYHPIKCRMQIDYLKDISINLVK